jgi:gluconolactonase
MFALKKARSLVIAVVAIASTVACFAGEKSYNRMSDENSAFFGISDRRVEKFAQLPEGVFIEGPVFDQKGNLWFVEIGSGWISRITVNGKYEKFFDTEYQWGPNGMTFDRDGQLVICHRQRGLISLNPQTKVVTTLVTEYNGKKFNGPNDLVFDAKGNIYFTDPWGTGLQNLTGAVYYFNRATGNLTKLFDNLAFPNGINLSNDGKYLYIGECNRNRILKSAVNPDGTIGDSYVMSQFSGGQGPDGLSLDVKGNIYQASFDASGVYVLDPMGFTLGFIKVPVGTGTTYAIFGGKDNRTLYITESWTNTIYTVKVPFPGQPRYHETWK